MRLLPAILAIAIVAVQIPTISAEPPNGIRAVVHDSVITADEVDIAITDPATRLAQQFRTQPEMFQVKLNELRGAKLDELLGRRLILHEFQTAGYNLPESIVDELVQEEIRAEFGDRVTATRSLQEKGITYEKFRQKMRDQFIVTALRQKNISSEIIISPHKVETYYLAHKDNFKMDDEVKLRMIVLNKTNDPALPDARKMAEEILAKLKGGDSFEANAKLYSQRKQQVAGGEWFQTSQLRKELAEATAKLKAGDYTEVIEFPDSCYLVRVEETRPTHVKSLGEVRGEIEKDLLSQERARLEKQWIERLKKKTFIQMFP
jgi:peptidyl-prolyl cis-trans isomerase SurA